MTSNNKKIFKPNLKTEMFPLAIIIATIIISLVSYQHLPSQVISHWDGSGQADGYSSRNFHVIFFPALIAGIYFLMNMLPKLDPKRQRYQEFANTYLIIRNLLLTTFLIIYAGATLVNLGYDINIATLISTTIGILFILLGNYFAKIKRNWFVGIKNPWTLSSENVWNKTHRLGGRLFVIWGIIILILPWLAPQAAFISMLTGAIVIVTAITIYSYTLYKKEKAVKSEDKE